MAKITKEEALRYHAEGKPGKIEVIPTKPHSTQTDLSLAYSPGVAEPCLEIEKNPLDAYEYTAKGNLVAVISNGTAVLGLGDIGPLAGKPVMEGKGLLFKIFAGHRRIRYRGKRERSGEVYPDREGDLAHVRRNQLGGYQGTGVFRDRDSLEERAGYPQSCTMTSMVRLSSPAPA